MSEKSVSSRESAHSWGVPHKHILASIRLQHKLGDAVACRGVTAEHDGGGHRCAILAATCGIRGHDHIQVRPWGNSGNVDGAPTVMFRLKSTFCHDVAGERLCVVKYLWCSTWRFWRSQSCVGTTRLIWPGRCWRPDSCSESCWWCPRAECGRCNGRRWDGCLQLPDGGWEEDKNDHL